MPEPDTKSARKRTRKPAAASLRSPDQPKAAAPGSDRGARPSATAAPGPEERPKIPDTLPILPTRGVAVFPGIIASLSIGRPGSRKLLEESLPQSKIIGLFAQKDPEKDDVGAGDLYRVGVAATVLKLMRQPEDAGVVIV